MSLRHILLGLLDKPRSGYEVKKMFESTMGHFWAVELSQIYTTLYRMQKETLVTSHSEFSSLGPNRRVYNLTRKGNDLLLEWLGSSPEMGDERFSYLSKLFFMDRLSDTKSVLAFMRELRKKFSIRLEKLEEVERLWQEECPSFPENLPNELFYPFLTLRCGLMRLEASLRWCDECIQSIKKRRTLREKADKKSRGDRK
jgi:DNA-binding PadR family transcriptional regulator